MDNCAQKMVEVYDGDELIDAVPRDEARRRNAAGTHSYINHGRALRVVKQEAGKRDATRDLLGWRPRGRMRRCAINEGGRGQNVARYPIPYAYKGHLTMPRAAVINQEVTGAQA